MKITGVVLSAIVFVYLAIAAIAFEWRNPIANEAAIVQRPIAVLTFKKLYEFQVPMEYYYVGEDSTHAKNPPDPRIPDSRDLEIFHLKQDLAELEKTVELLRRELGFATEEITPEQEFHMFDGGKVRTDIEYPDDAVLPPGFKQ